MVINENIETKVAEKCDVLVCGGGIAGVAAALSAARMNKTVILCEREFLLGGLATAGLVALYLPLCDGMGRQVSFGIAEELLKLSISQKVYRTRGYNDWIANPKAEKNGKTPRYEVDFNPNLFAVAMEQLLIENGVKILYGTVAVKAYEEGGAITSVIFENKTGRFAVAPKGVVDATGDCDIAKHLPVQCKLHPDKNPLAGWYYFYSNNRVGLNPLGVCDISDEEAKKGNAAVPLSKRRFSGVDGEELSLMTQLSHRSVLNDYRKRLAEFPDYDLVNIASIPQIRMTRKLAGEYELDEADSHKEFQDSVGLISDWRKRGPVFEVPFRTLFSKKIRNLAVAGRCISVTDKMWDITRVIPCCAVTGQAAGAAVALSPDLTATDTEALQHALKQSGVRLHEKEL